MQIVGYEPAGADPAVLLLAADRAVTREPLVPGSEIDYGLGDRHCAGALDGDSHDPCDAPAAPRCAIHADDWPCARCRGDCTRPRQTCREPHDVYLAAFPPAVFKVGVTRAGRLERRLREQGAARGTRIRRVEDGRRARRIEARLADRPDLTDRVRVQTKIDGLASAVDEAAWRALLDGFDHDDVLRFDRDLALDARPVAATMAAGRVCGSVGRVAVLDRGATSYAVDLRDLVGYEVRPGAADPARQTSLGAFD
ncbi:MAG: DUF2797 domain-containing protein [Halobacteriaceae archaeon]